MVDEVLLEYVFFLIIRLSVCQKSVVSNDRDLLPAGYEMPPPGDFDTIQEAESQHLEGGDE